MRPSKSKNPETKAPARNPRAGGRKSKKPRHDPHTEALRERVVRGAASAFGRLGYADTRVEDIVEDTGISRPTFYKVFESKDAVFFALSERHHAAIRERLDQAAASSPDPILQLERSIESFLRWRTELGPVGRVLDLEARGPSSRLAADRKGTLEHAIGLVQRGLARAGREPVDSVLLRALVAAAENVADELFTELPVPESTLQRAKDIVFRLHGGALGQAGDPIPPIPPAPTPKKRAIAKR